MNVLKGIAKFERKLPPLLLGEFIVKVKASLCGIHLVVLGKEVKVVPCRVYMFSIVVIRISKHGVCEEASIR